MTATITRLPVSQPQPAPDEADASACFAALLYEAAIAEGERRVYARLGIPQPAPARSRHLVLSSPGPAS